MSRHHWIILNRAVCNRCQEELVSLPAAEEQMCGCGYLAIAGGREKCVRTCMDLTEEDQPFRDFVDTSVITDTFIRRGGLIVEAFRTESSQTVVGPDSRSGLALPGDYIVFEPEGGHTAWTPEEFHARHAHEPSNWS